ncbi:hypothetical protein SDC9_168780 [bioreactor metagenome]|uniref:Uncharacterized protein n=1 Tax=bioreactor metagenome TaxID=1076179 RepID=A0A645G3G1_9ZZZZ
MFGEDFYIEGVWFDDFLVAEQVILPLRKTNLVHAPAEAMQFNRHLRGTGINWLAFLEKEHAELRRNAALEDGHFGGEIAVGQEASAMRAFGGFGRGWTAMTALAGNVGCRFGIARHIPGEASARQKHQNGCRNLFFVHKEIRFGFFKE